MAIKPHNVRVVQYFFPETHVVALKNHDLNGDRSGTKNIINHVIDEIPAEDGRLQHAVEVEYSSDDEAGTNPPYSFKIVAFGIFEPEKNETEELVNDYLRNLEAVAIQVLFGAIREHMASVTARSAWSTFIAGATNLRQKEETEESVELTHTIDSE